MALLDKAAILAADDLPTEDVHVEAWGGEVRVRGLTGTERDRFEFQLAAGQKDASEVNVRASVVGRCIVDESGRRLFTDKELAKLGAKSGSALDEVFDVVRRLSGMLPESVDAAAESFDGAPSDGSSSG